MGAATSLRRGLVGSSGGSASLQAQDPRGVHVVITGVKNRSHLVYIASYVRTLVDGRTPIRVSFVAAPAFLASTAVTVDDAREILPQDATVTVEDGMPGWRFAPGARCLYVAVGAPGFKALVRLRRANPPRRIEVVVTDEGIGSYATAASRRAALERHGTPAVRAAARTLLTASVARVCTTLRWPAYRRDRRTWRPVDAVADEFRRELAGATPGQERTAIILTQPVVDLGWCSAEAYVAYLRRLADAATAAGLRPLVRPHPAEARERYAEFDVMPARGTAELDPDVVRAAVALGGPSTALINLSAMHGSRVVWVSEPSVAHLDTDVSVDQAGIFRAFLGDRVPLDAVGDAVRAAIDAPGGGDSGGPAHALERRPGRR